MAGNTNFPSSLDSASSGNPFGFALVVNLKSTTLNGAISSGDTTITVASTSGFTSRGIIVVDSEVITYTGVSGGTQFTGCSRGVDGTTAASHASGATVANVLVAANINDLAAAIVAAETKVGTGSSTPTADTVLAGTGTGTSGWSAADLTAWTTFTPTVTQSGSVTVTTDYAEYCVIGKLVKVQMKLTVTGSGTTNNAIVIGSIPAAIQPLRTGQNVCIGSASLLDSGTAFYVGNVHANAASGWQIIVHNQGSFVGILPNFALAVNDVISISAEYQIA